MKLALFIPIFLLSACSSSADNLFAEEVQNSVRAKLKDPDSAKFQDLRSFAEARVACGKVNSKNSFGGYVGYEEFSYYLEEAYLESEDMTAKVEGSMRCTMAEAERAIVKLKQESLPKEEKENLINARLEQIEGLKQSIYKLTAE
jgi:hypothetical protein